MPCSRLTVVPSGRRRRTLTFVTEGADQVTVTEFPAEMGAQSGDVKWGSLVQNGAVTTNSSPCLGTAASHVRAVFTTKK
jgi:hypothetical protein